jgi:N-acetylmuramoyl-L-alanine amidase
MRDIHYLVLHCTAGNPKQKTSDILHYWKNTLKWKSVGYHYLIDADGTITQLADESQITNGVAGFNKVSIHISYKGGVENGKSKDTRTEAQKLAILGLLKTLRKKYPKAIIQGHRDFGAKKACPSFDAKSEFKHI